MRQFIRATALALVICFLFSLIVQVQAATPTSFCKCTCFKKSMIIPLDAPNKAATVSKSAKRSPFSAPNLPHRDTDEDDLPSAEPPLEKIPYKHKTCSDCNKSFCLDLGLPDCKDATEEDVSTSCFQRDSSKDEAVVFIFIFATAGLLAWALVKPFAGRWLEQVKERRAYIPLSSSQDR